MIITALVILSTAFTSAEVTLLTGDIISMIEFMQGTVNTAEQATIMPPTTNPLLGWMPDFHTAGYGSRSVIILHNVPIGERYNNLQPQLCLQKVLNILTLMSHDLWM
jgi:hypothetical protein